MAHLHEARAHRAVGHEGPDRVLLLLLFSAFSSAERSFVTSRDGRLGQRDVAMPWARHGIVPGPVKRRRVLVYRRHDVRPRTARRSGGAATGRRVLVRRGRAERGRVRVPAGAGPHRGGAAHEGRDARL